MSDFIHLHNHTQYSLLDGACRVDKLCAMAKEHNMPAIAMTDHGNLFGAIDFYQSARAASLKPIIGIEAYIAPEKRGTRKIVPGIKGAAFHLILLARNYQGYKNLLKLSSDSYLNGFYYKPRIDIDILREHADGLIGLSACIKGEIPAAILGAHILSPDEAVKKYLDVFGPDNFYLEMHDHDIEEEVIVRRGLLELHRKYNIPMVAANDCHYLRAEDASAHDKLLCIQTRSKVSDANRLKYSTNQLYFRSADEMKALFSKYEGSIENTLAIADRCENYDLPLGKLRLPLFKTPDGILPEKYLASLIAQGREQRGLGGGQVSKRLRYEYKTIKDAGYASYFLIVHDLVQWAKSNGIMVGPGRGSVAGSLVAYVLGITEINPLEHNLLFERFLNPERISPPDIDLDFPDDKRGAVVDYIKHKYGDAYVSQIITFGTLSPRSLVRDMARVLGMSYDVGDNMAKLIPANSNSLEEARNESPEFNEYVNNNFNGKDIYEPSLVLEGLNRHAGTHAAGVVIGDVPLVDIVPFYKSAKDEITTQYDMYSIDAIGLLKIDVLGLKTLRVISDTLNMIAVGERPDLNKINMSDPVVFDVFRKGNTTGIFQFESDGMRSYLKKMNVDCFNDLVAMNALYRPGPLEANMVDTYINRKTGVEEVEYLHDSMSDALSDTYGIMVFQEQIMRVAQDVAGYTLGEADILRKACGKKIASMMAEQHDTFIQRAIARGVDAAVAESIWDQIKTFASYGFNKSHSNGYAMLAYQTAYLKAYYPVEFMAALLTSEVNDLERTVMLLHEAARLGIKVLPPSVNESNSCFTAANGEIRFGLSGIKGVGAKCVEAIVEERNANGVYSSIVDFCSRVKRRSVHRGVMQSLVASGAFDVFGYTRAGVSENLQTIIDLCSFYNKDKHRGQQTILADVTSISIDKLLINHEEWPMPELLQREYDLLGFYVSGHPLDKYEKIIDFTSDKLDTADNGEGVHMIGVVRNFQSKRAKQSGSEYYSFDIEDYYGLVRVVVFGAAYERCRHCLTDGAIIAIDGVISHYKDGAMSSIRLNDAIVPQIPKEDFVVIDGTVDTETFNRDKYNSIRVCNDQYFIEIGLS